MSKYTVLEKLLSFEDIESQNNDLNNLNKLTKFKYFPKDIDELRDIINERMQKECSTNIDANDICVSNITDMTALFYCSEFNGDISEWDVHNVKNMQDMFMSSSFNGDISKWNVHNVENMAGMFCDSRFNGDISEWDVSNVTNMIGMFSNSKFTKKEELLLNWKFNPLCNRNLMFYLMYGSNNNSLDEKLLSFEDKDSKDTDLENFNELTKYNYYPKDKEELYDIVDELIKERGRNANLNDVCTSRITDMSYLFYEIDFNGDISKWDVSNVENMNYMFYGSEFNKDISGWNVSNVEDMSYMFANSVFNGDISNWDVSNVENMNYMFYGSEFNKDISGWNVSNVKNMGGMFGYSKFTYKHEIENNWNIHPDCNTTAMFWKCPVDKPELQEKLLSFEDKDSKDNDIENLNKLTRYNYYPKTRDELKELIRKLIRERGNNANLNDICTSQITNMGHLFANSLSINPDISEWDVSNVRNMRNMFMNSADFNGDISKWDVSRVEDMNGMFSYSGKFNCDISKWNVSNVTDMRYMFYYAHSFNKDISNWDVSKVKKMNNMFACSDLSKTNRVLIKNKWEKIISPECDTYWAFGYIENSADINEKLLSFEDTETEDKDLENLNELTRYNYYPKTRDELKELIRKLISKRGDNADLNDIYTGDITDMNCLFSYSFFNGDISKWDVSNVRDMSCMFYNSKFNGDISKWNVSNVKDISYMFYNSKFNGDVSKWNINPKCNTYEANFPKKKVNEKLLSFEDTETKDNDLEKLNNLSKIIVNKKWFEENCDVGFHEYLKDIKDKNCTFVRIKKKHSDFLFPLYNYMNKTTYEILSPNMWFDIIDKFGHGFGAFSATPDHENPDHTIANFINEKGELLRPDLSEQLDQTIGFSDLPDAAWIKFKTDEPSNYGVYEDYIRRDGSLVFNNLDGHIKFETHFYNYKYNNLISHYGVNFDDYTSQNFSIPEHLNGKNTYMVISEKDKGYNLIDINFNLVSPNLYFDKILRPGSYVTNTTWVKVMKDGKFNYLNCETGEIISKDLWFDKVSDSFLIKNKVAKVLYNGTYYFIDENGELYEDANKTKKVDIEKIKSEDTSKKDSIFEECWFGEADNYQNMPKYFYERRKSRNTEKNRPWYAVYILLSKHGIMRKDMILSLLWPGKTGLQLELFQFLNSAKIAETIKSGPNRGYLTANKYNNWNAIKF